VIQTTQEKKEWPPSKSLYSLRTHKRKTSKLYKRSEVWEKLTQRWALRQRFYHWDELTSKRFIGSQAHVCRIFHGHIMAALFKQLLPRIYNRRHPPPPRLSASNPCFLTMVSLRPFPVCISFNHGYFTSSSFLFSLFLYFFIFIFLTCPHKKKRKNQTSDLIVNLLNIR
jgi:hypothetical protein